jgi:urease accessory protein
MPIDAKGETAASPEAEALRQQALLAAWFSPSFPIGGFAFSHGLEWAQEAGGLSGLTALEAWIGDALQFGSGRQDAILMNAARRAAIAGDAAAIAEVVALGAAAQPSRERFMEATVQGRAFFDLARALYPHASLNRLDAALTKRMTFAVAAGLVGAAHRVEAAALTAAYLSGFVANLASAAVRLGVVGQTDGQRVIAALAGSVITLAREATRLTLDDLGGAALRSDLASLLHEVQNARLFRS